MTELRNKDHAAPFRFALAAAGVISVLFAIAKADKTLSFNSAMLALFLVVCVVVDKVFLPKELLKSPSIARYHAFEIAVVLLYQSSAAVVFALLIFLWRALVLQRAVEAELVPGSRGFLFHCLGCQTAYFELNRRQMSQLGAVVASAFAVLLLRKFRPEAFAVFSVIPFALAVFFAVQVLPSSTNFKSSGVRHE